MPPMTVHTLSLERWEAGIGELERLAAQYPGSIEHRVALLNGRKHVEDGLLRRADAHRRGGRLGAAQAAFQEVLQLNPQSAFALEGLAGVRREQRHQVVIAGATQALGSEDRASHEAARQSLRMVLIENPFNQEAIELNALFQSRLESTRVQPKQLADSFRKPISLQFRDASLLSVFEVISKVSGLNFMFDSEAPTNQTVTFSIKETTIESVVDLILVSNGLKMKLLNDHSILVYQDTPHKTKQYESLVMRTFMIAHGDPTSVANALVKLAQVNEVTVDERLGTLTVRDTPERIRIAEHIIALQDLGMPEVMLEVEVLEVKRSRLQELGIQWPGQLSLSPLPDGNDVLTLRALRDIDSGTTRAELGSLNINLQASDQDANILANPRIRVRSKEKANVLIGERVPVITTTSTSTGFVSESVDYIDVGLKLEVEPHVQLNDEVAIKISLEVSNLVREVRSQSGTLAYQIGSRSAETLLQLKNGETQVLAGLISDEDRQTANSVPGLSRIPLLGKLFGSNKNEGERSEIFLSITPRIIHSLKAKQHPPLEMYIGTETRIGSSPLQLVPAQATQ